jgi:hypothetical protein
MMSQTIARVALTLTVAVAAGCGGATPSSPDYAAFSQAVRATTANLPTPALVTFDTANNSLAYWPIKRGGSLSAPTPFTDSLGVADVSALAGYGDVVIVVNYSPAEVVTYNVKTKAKTEMSDPYGGPYDVAVDKKGNIYAMNAASVAVFKSGSSQATELSCSDMNLSEAIAVDDEGDVFVNGFGPGSSLGTVEYPAGSQSCSKLNLRAEQGYPAGIGIDPKTDDLIVIDDPDLCAGGLEGLMHIYPRPYEARHSIRRVLNATYCAGTFRLDAGSTHIFYSDATVSAGEPIIDQARYPSGKSEGQYWEGYFGSGGFVGFTTIPNRLPN